jgi:hypothetical protein
MKKNFNKYNTYLLHSKIFFWVVVTKTYPPYIEIDKIPPGGEGIPYIYVWLVAYYIYQYQRGPYQHPPHPAARDPYPLCFAQRALKKGA